jgi:hypothetical protein
VTRSPLAGPELVEDAILRHLEEPRGELAAERELRQALEDAQKDLLRQVLGKRTVADETQNVVEDRRLVRADDEGERALVTPLCLPQNCEVWLLE